MQPEHKLEWIDIEVDFPEEGISLTMTLEPLGEQRFCVRSVPILVESVSFGDVIEAERLPEGGYRFIQLIEAGGWVVYDVILSPEQIESESIKRVRERVVSLGGHWEGIMGGIMLFCLPHDSGYDPIKDLQAGA